MKALLRSALCFTAIGLLLYAALYAGSEALLLQQGRSNPFYKISQLGAGEQAGWVVLGASHAMPLDFDGIHADLERVSGQRIVPLAGPGTGPFYSRWVLEHYLGQGHRAAQLLYVADAFTFDSRTWNEDRVADAKLLRRTPWSAALSRSLAAQVAAGRVDLRAWLDYTTGFSKINNPDRFDLDVWEGEAQFDRAGRASASATRKRIAYLYPDGQPAEALARYLDDLDALLAMARRHGMAPVVIKMPLPAGVRRALPDEAGFDAALAALAARHGARLADFSAAIDDATLYFDTDHLNRRGLTQLAEAWLVPLLRTPPPASGARVP